MDAEAITRFTEKFTALSGAAHVAASREAAAEIIAAIVDDARANCVALAGLSDALTEAVRERCGTETLTGPYAAADLPNAIDRAEVGVTGIAFAIADTGTLAEITTDDATRLVSSLPRTHIGVVNARDIVGPYEDAAQRIREAIQDNPEDCVISFISGPSRTGDIELKLTLGVHGPENAHALILTGEAQE